LWSTYSGAGPIGLISLLSARAAGAEPIVITDLFQSRLDFAKKLVPGVRTVLIKRGTTPKEQAQEIKEAAGGALKLCLECTGVESSVHTAVYVGFLCLFEAVDRQFLPSRRNLAVKCSSSAWARTNK
jgi:threonine dehydrogenase-like Zn-dependent dehydrogenase